jgi:hypothetical protein
MSSRGIALCVVGLVLAGCWESPSPRYQEPREACAERHPLREAYFGDLHLHTRFSFDAYGYQVDVTPEDAYRFARGEPVWLPPLDTEGQPTREVRLPRPSTSP